jgi:phosphatidate cytidylyltransferase
MALNLATLKTRALTALVFVAVMLGGIFYNQWSFFILFVIIQIGCWLEYFKLIKLIDPHYLKSFLTIAKYVLLGVVYIALPCVLMTDLYTQSANLYNEMGWLLPMVIIATIWINDTMAYLVGSLIGKTPLSAISPKKTWEGTIGGAILAIGVVTWGANYIYTSLNINTLLLISTTAAITGTLGDLLESKLKRMAGVKDSGQIMPGHGGFLDRFDSLLIATTAVWLVLFLYL